MALRKIESQPVFALFLDPGKGSDNLRISTTALGQVKYAYTSPGNLSEIATQMVYDVTAKTREYITTIKQPGCLVVASNTRKYRMFAWGQGLAGTGSVPVIDNSG